MVFGVYSLGFSAPFIKAVNDGRISAASVLRVIKRKVPIPVDDKNASVFDPNVEGDIIF